MLAAYRNITLAIVNLVNASRGNRYDQYRNKLYLKAGQREQLFDTAKMIMAHRLSPGMFGELSLRLSAHHLVITARWSHLAHLAETDLVICSTLANSPSGDSAALHLNWHRLIYRETQAESVLLCQPPYTLTLINAAKLPLPQIAPEIWEAVGGVKLINPANISEAHLAEAVRQSHAMLVPQLGALIWGHSMADLLARAEALEFVSQLTATSYQTGLMPVLPIKN
jgi:ribulose-5-phosphate 4-epimerase/fuculose-1-phosphate aldolase